MKEKIEILKLKEKYKICLSLKEYDRAKMILLKIREKENE